MLCHSCNESCLVAIHGTLPPYVEKDLKTFILFYVAPIQFNFDSKTGQVLDSTKEHLVRSVTKTFTSATKVAVLLGLMSHYSYELFPRKQVYKFVDLFYWGNLMNNYAMACKCVVFGTVVPKNWQQNLTTNHLPVLFSDMTGICLETGSRAVGTLTELITGKSVIELSDSPMTASTSPSDFWGRRWNALVHLVLKGGVYIPLRKNGFSKMFAALSTFVASGLLHEWVLMALAFKGVLLGEDHSSSTPKYGYHFAFFVWNGIVLALEGLFHKHPIVQRMKQILPAPIITMLVIMTVLPIGHWFTGEWLPRDLGCCGLLLRKYVLF